MGTSVNNKESIPGVEESYTNKTNKLEEINYGFEEQNNTNLWKSLSVKCIQVFFNYKIKTCLYEVQVEYCC